MDMALDQPHMLDDTALLVLYANGDPEAASILTDRLAPRLLRFATRMLGDAAEAEDVVQDAMLRLWKIAPDWRSGEAQISTWLYRVAKNLCTDRLRKKRGIDLNEIAEPQDDTPGAEARMMEQERLTALNAALETLPDRQKEAVVLRHIEGLGNPEIAQILSISVEAVESLTARGKRALGVALAGKEKELGL